MMLMTLGAWLVAFVVVLALLTLLGDELESLPLAWRALVITGVLVTLMVNLVMPVLNVAIARWLSGGHVSGPPPEGTTARVAGRPENKP
jgi:antibiotic biosynthesis monooxygenase (ABM) superfamily enzyme